METPGDNKMCYTAMEAPEKVIRWKGDEKIYGRDDFAADRGEKADRDVRRCRRKEECTPANARANKKRRFQR